MLAGKVATSRSSDQEIMDHLASYLLGRFAYALVGDAVIRCIDNVHGMPQDRRLGLLAQSHVQGERLERSQ